MAPREKDLNAFCARSIDQLPQQSSSRLFLWGAPFFRVRFCESQFVCRWPTRDLYCGATQNFDLPSVWGASFPPQYFRVQFPCCGSKASRFPPQACLEKGNGKKSCSQQGNSYTNRFAISSPSERSQAETNAHTTKMRRPTGRSELAGSWAGNRLAPRPRIANPHITGCLRLCPLWMLLSCDHKIFELSSVLSSVIDQ